MYLIDKIEGVVCNATWQLLVMKGLTYPERLKKLKLSSLRYWASPAVMMEKYKTTHGHYSSDLCKIIQLWSTTTDHSELRSHKSIQSAKPTGRKESFALRAVKVRNMLSEVI